MSSFLGGIFMEQQKIFDELNYHNVSSIEKNQSTRHKIPFGVSEVEQIEGFLGKKE